MKLSPVPGTNYVRIDTGCDAIGPIQLWAPEAVASPRGFSSIYPRGVWFGDDTQLRQHVGPDGLCGGGNCPRLDAETFECVGIRVPAEPPVEWDALVTAGSDRVDFSITLTNLGDRPIRQAGAPVCVKFLNAPWWSDRSVYVCSGGDFPTLADLGRGAGQPNGFQAYLVGDRTFDNPFYREFWGFNAHRLEQPVLVSEHRASNRCVVVSSPGAYFLHSNPGNPCTDVMVAFGDLAPGATATARGLICIVRDKAKFLMVGLEDLRT